MMVSDVNGSIKSTVKFETVPKKRYSFKGDKIRNWRRFISLNITSMIGRIYHENHTFISLHIYKGVDKQWTRINKLTNW